MKNGPVVKDLVLLVVFKRLAVDPGWVTMMVFGDSETLEARRVELELGLKAMELFIVVFSRCELEDRLWWLGDESAWNFVLRSNADPCVRFA